MAAGVHGFVTGAMADALARTADVVITQGATQSNHARQTVAIAAKLGMQSHIILEDRTGYSFDEVRGRNCRFLQGEETRQPELEILRRALSEGSDCNVILRNFRKDGELFWNHLFISPVRDESGNITHFVGIKNDLT